MQRSSRFSFYHLVQNTCSLHVNTAHTTVLSPVIGKQERVHLKRSV